MNSKKNASGLVSEQLVERRRPGRVEYVNPHLIALLRRSPSAVPTPASSDGEDFFDAEVNGTVAASISLLDGACQVGSLWPVDSQNATVFLSDMGCYKSGTKIATTSGVKVADTLSVGDVVVTGAASRTIVGIKRFGSGVHPIYMRRHALAEGVPGHDLWVAPTQCVVVEGRLVPTAVLANGLTILPDESQSSAIYLQIRFAEPETDQPVTNAADVAAIHRQLTERASDLGYIQHLPIGPEDADLQIYVNGKALNPVEVFDNRRTFIVPPHKSLRLCSQSDLNVTRIEVAYETEYEVISADHPALLSGWGPAQYDGYTFWRPITGPANLPIGPITSPAKIIVWLQV